MTSRGLVRRYVWLRALRWMPLGVGLPFYVLLPADRGIGLGAIGVVWGVHSLVALLLEVPSGALADAVGRRTALLAGGVMTAAGLALFAMATAVAGFVVAVAAVATGRALMSGSLEAWFVDELREREPDAVLHGAFASGTAAEGMGLAAGAAIGGLLPLLATGLPATGDARLVELSVPLLAGGVGALAYVLAVIRYVDEAPRPRAARTVEVARDTVAMARDGLATARRSFNVRRLLGITAIVGMAMSSVELLWQPRLDGLLVRDATGAAPLFGALVAGSMLMVSLGATLSRRVVRHTGRRRLYTGAHALLAMTLGALAVVTTPVLFCAAFLIFFALLGAADPVHSEMLHDAVEGPARATVVSTEQLTLQAGGAGGNLALGPLAAVAGFGVAWAVPAVACVGAALLAAATLPRVSRVATPRPRPAAPSGAA